ncbi:odorant receptor 131-2-like [Polyodon spathula]|uniref:odorant receptor 131-2-like n=1 Tax=Polyodon spathula TaxID=7913 RepID=UPI001B7D9B99|nr:odorant receptor 131-2-like [Polyodon spathula]
MNLCSFTQFNSSGLTVDHAFGNNSRFSVIKIIENWSQVLTYGGGKFFIIPAAVSLVAVLPASPLVLLAIFSSNTLYQETRYRLLANTLISDLIYCIVNLTITATNIAPFFFTNILCQFLLILLSTTYFTGILNVTAMVVDVFLAINWPLRYISFLPTPRAVKLIVGIWVVSTTSSIFIYVFLSAKETMLCKIPVCIFDIIFFIKPVSQKVSQLYNFIVIILFTVCFVLIVGCYCMMYWKTRSCGIWNGFSRARQTFSLHSVLFFFYFCPVIILMLETVLYSYYLMDLQSMVYSSMIMSNIVMMLPRALIPYIYGLRSRELSKTIKSMIKYKVQISPGE